MPSRSARLARSRPHPAILFAAFFVLAWGLLAGGIHTLTQNNTLGTDFYIFYHSGQAAFQQGADPYSLDLARQNQLAIFKRPAQAGEDQLGFAYPLFALFVIYPLLGLPFDWAQAIWAAFLLLGLLVALLLAFPRARPLVVASLVFFYPITFGLVLGNFAILIAALLLGVYALLLRPSAPALLWQILAGLALAWLCAKPQLTWLYILFFLLAAWRLRWKGLLGGFGLGLAGLVGLSFLARPTWAAEWLASLSAYAQYNATIPTATVLLMDVLPPGLATALTYGLGLVLLAVTAWLFWRWYRGRLVTLLLFAWLGLVIYLLHPHGKSYEHVAYLVPLAIWAAGLPSLRRLPFWLFWAGSLLLSWIVFFISIQPAAPASATEWPVLFQGIWVGWLFYKYHHRGMALKGADAKDTENTLKTWFSP